MCQLREITFQITLQEYTMCDISGIPTTNSIDQYIVTESALVNFSFYYASVCCI
jgi:hypothetical protein